MAPVSEARTTSVIRKAPGRRASDAGRSRLGDLTRPIAKEQRIAPNRRPAVLLGVAGLVVAVGDRRRPVRSARAHVVRAERRDRPPRTAARRAAVGQRRPAARGRPAAAPTNGIMAGGSRGARLIFAGERRQTVVNMPDLPTDLPDGWPYGPVEQMIVLRGDPAAAAAATTTVAPTSTTVLPPVAMTGRCPTSLAAVRMWGVTVAAVAVVGAGDGVRQLGRRRGVPRRPGATSPRSARCSPSSRRRPTPMTCRWCTSSASANRTSPPTCRPRSSRELDDEPWCGSPTSAAEAVDEDEAHVPVLDAGVLLGVGEVADAGATGRSR